MINSVGTSLTWLRLRSLPEAALLGLLTALAIVEYSIALPHPLGTPMEPSLHVANLIPFLGVATVGALLRPRWEPTYSQASVGAPTTTGRSILVAGVVVGIAAISFWLWRLHAIRTLILTIAIHLSAGCGITLGTSGLFPRSSVAPLATGSVVALSLGVSPWWGATVPFIGNAVGEGMTIGVIIAELTVGIIGAAILILAGTQCWQGLPRTHKTLDT